MNRLKWLSVPGALAPMPRRGRVAPTIAGAVLAGCLALPSSGAASTTFGSDLTAMPNLDIACNNPCVQTLANAGLPNSGLPSSPVTGTISPVTGTIVRWRLRTGSGSNGNIQLRVLFHLPVNHVFGSGTGASEAIPTTATTTTFSAQLPINRGSEIAVDVSLGASGRFLAMATGRTGANVGIWSPSVPDGFFGPGTPSSDLSDTELLFNADVAALPTSTVAIPACSTTGTVAATVTPDPDPAVAPKAIRFRIDGGAEQTQATSGNPGSAAIPVADGSHTLEYWGEDSVGGLESPHHTATVVGCSATAGETTAGGTTTGGSTTGATTNTTTVPPLAPNAFSVAGAKQLRDGSIRVKLTSPGAGAYQAIATFTGKSRFAQPPRKRKTTTGTFGRAAANATAAGAVTLRIRPTRRARAALRRTHRLAVSVAITFTPNGGNPSTQTKKVTVKKPKAKKKRRSR